MATMTWWTPTVMDGAAIALWMGQIVLWGLSAWRAPNVWARRGSGCLACGVALLPAVLVSMEVSMPQGTEGLQAVVLLVVACGVEALFVGGIVGGFVAMVDVWATHPAIASTTLLGVATSILGAGLIGLAIQLFYVDGIAHWICQVCGWAGVAAFIAGSNLVPAAWAFLGAPARDDVAVR